MAVLLLLRIHIASSDVLFNIFLRPQVSNVVSLHKSFLQTISSQTSILKENFNTNAISNSAS